VSLEPYTGSSRSSSSLAHKNPVGFLRELFCAVGTPPRGCCGVELRADGAGADRRTNYCCLPEPWVNFASFFSLTRAAPAHLDAMICRHLGTGAIVGLTLSLKRAAWLVFGDGTAPVQELCDTRWLHLAEACVRYTLQPVLLFYRSLPPSALGHVVPVHRGRLCMGPGGNLEPVRPPRTVVVGVSLPCLAFPCSLCVVTKARPLPTLTSCAPVLLACGSVCSRPRPTLSRFGLPPDECLPTNEASSSHTLGVAPQRARRSTITTRGPVAVAARARLHHQHPGASILSSRAHTHTRTRADSAVGASACDCSCFSTRCVTYATALKV